jgi:hypothetical protein
MTPHENGKALVLRENSEWLRHVLWGTAIGMCFLAVSAVNSPARDVGKIIGSALGVLLLGFSGLVLQSRRLVVDPFEPRGHPCQQGILASNYERLKFDEIKRILVLMTYDSVENLRGVNVPRERWSIAFVLKERSVPVTGLTDPLRAEIIALAREGRRIDAIKRYRDATGQDLTTAKDVVDLLVPR